MYSISKKNINFVALIITIIIFSFINYSYSYFNNPKEIQVVNESLDIQMSITEENTIEITEEVKEQETVERWKIMIPVIDLIADIKEGTDEETLNSFVGHFEETSKISGNVGLAAHNRGYQVNYFARLKELQLEDIIIYQYGELTKYYSISDIKLIYDIDWTPLQETCSDTLTLITCVENQPKLRRCVQARHIDIDGRNEFEK